MTREIPLTRGKFALVDDEDHRWASLCSWQCMKAGYAATYSYKKHYYMHRLIMNAPKGLVVDHINGNKLDNRKKNLRICTQRQNRANSLYWSREKTSRFRGVCWNDRAGKWMVQMQIDMKRYYLGLYDCEYEAAKVYNNRAIIEYGEFAAINIIDE